MPIRNPSCAVAFPRERNNATDVAHATNGATVITPNASKPSSLQELRAQLRAQLVRNPGAESETEQRTESRESEGAIRAGKASCAVALAKERNTQLAAGVFSFNPPGDLTNDDEALVERAANMAKANGWNAATALREMRWDTHRERCWHAFLLNAKRVLDPPQTHREGLLARYQVEAAVLPLRRWSAARW